ncbi:MAG: hypothetical protein H7210_00875 [Pyrinomonadaceae bacterium]|nr:hypothetical protein [Phycisphaerales bacterium]
MTRRAEHRPVDNQQPPTRHRCITRALRILWLRGFLPVGLCVGLWLFSAGGRVHWQGTSLTEPRAVLGQGVVAVCWNSKAAWKGLGQVRWALGTGMSVNGRRITWYVQRPLWSGKRFEMQRYAVVKPGNVQIPLFYLVGVSLVFPLMSWIARRRHRPPWACDGCGYDLRGTTGTRCPECGRMDGVSRPA